MRSPRAFLVAVFLLSIATPGAAAPEPADPTAASSVIVDEIRAEAATVRQQLRTARAHRDMVKTLCLNDKLTQLDVALRSAGQRREALLAAVAQADAAAVQQERARLDVHREQGRRVASEAQQCLGSPDPSGDERGQTSMTTPPLPSQGDYPAPVDLVVVGEPPGAVSAYK